MLDLTAHSEAASLHTDSVHNMAVRACFNAAICVEAAVLAVMSMTEELDRTAGRTEPVDAALSTLIKTIDPLNGLVVGIAEEYERLTGRRHGILDPLN